MNLASIDHNIYSTYKGLDGQRVIIFGGEISRDDELHSLEPHEALYVLDLINWKWDIPIIKGKSPNSRLFHQTNVIGKYMVISFGKR